MFCHQVREGDIRTRCVLGGGALFDMGIYCLNAARYVFQEEPLSVYAEQDLRRRRPVRGRRRDDHCCAPLPGQPLDGKAKTHTAAKRDQFAPELVHFSQCILTGEEPVPSALEGRADVRIMQAMVLSAKTGARIDLSPVVQSRRPNIELMTKKPPTKKIKPVRSASPSK